jgi:nucleotide-binding universal stress UspA family protein
MLGYTKILCALNFDDHLNTTFLLAAALAKENNATLYLLHVASVPLGVLDVPLPFVANPKWEREARQRLEDLVRQYGQTNPHFEIIVKSGLPDVDIVDQANQLGVDLIVVGTHGRHGVSHLLLGSVAEQVIRYAKCPVLVMRPARRDQGAPPGRSE